MDYSFGSVSSAQAVAEAVAGPALLAAPGISGVSEVGQTLTTTQGQWAPTDTIAVEWLRDGIPISGATALTYAVQPTDEGRQLQVRVTATKGGVSTIALTAVVTIALVAPSAAGLLADQSHTEATGVYTYDVSPDFSGTDLIYTISTGPGQIDASGVISFDTDLLAVQTATSVVVTASNSSGTAQSGFSLTIAAAVAAQTITFGENTAIGAAGVATTAADGTYGQFGVSAGIVTPNATPLTIGNTAIGADTITVEPGYRSAGTEDEILAAFNAIGAAGGETIKARTGVIAMGVSRLAKNLTFAAPVTLTGEPGAILDGNTRFENAKNVVVEGLILRHLSATSGYILQIMGMCDDFVVQDCEVYGSYFDPLGDYTAAGAYNNVSGIGSVSATSGLNQNITVRRCSVHDVSTGIALTLDGAVGVDISHNEIFRTYSDAIKLYMTPNAVLASKTMNYNVAHSFLGDPADTDNPHIDFIQFGANATNDGFVFENIEIIGNIAWESTAARGRGVQGIASFVDTGATITMKDPRVVGNTMLLSGNHHITMQSVDGGTFAYNTLVNPAASYPTSGTARIALTTVIGGPEVRNNITEYATLNVTDVASVVLGRSGVDIPYGTVFTSGSLNFTDYTSLVAGIKTLANGAADLGGDGVPSAADAGALGSGAVAYGAPKIAAGWAYDPSYLASGGTLHVIPVAGQSNLIGRTSFDAGTTFPAGVSQWTQAGAIMSVEGLNQLDHRDAVATDISPLITFSEALIAANPSDTILFVPCCDGGTGFEFDQNGGTWDSTAVGSLFDIMVARCNAAVAASGGDLTAILWHQGEADINYAGYLDDLKAFISATRTAITAATDATPFVLGQIGAFASGANVINPKIENIAYTTPYTAVVDTSDLGTAGDNLHFTAAGYRAIGGRYFTSIATAAANSAPSYPTPSGLKAKWLFGTDATSLTEVGAGGSALTPVGLAPIYASNYLTKPEGVNGLESIYPETVEMTAVIAVRTYNKIAFAFGNLPPSGTGVGMFYTDAASSIKSGSVQIQTRGNPMSGLQTLGLNTSSADVPLWRMIYMRLSPTQAWEIGALLPDGTKLVSLSGPTGPRSLGANNLAFGNSLYASGTYDNEIDIAGGVFTDSWADDAALAALAIELSTDLSGRGITVAPS